MGESKTTGTIIQNDNTDLRNLRFFTRAEVNKMRSVENALKELYIDPTKIEDLSGTIMDKKGKLYGESIKPGFIGEAEFTRQAKITLPFKVPNPVFCSGISNPMEVLLNKRLSRDFGIDICSTESYIDYAKIYNCDIVYNIEENTFITARGETLSRLTTDKILYGGNLIAYLLSKLDNNRLLTYLELEVRKAAKEFVGSEAKSEPFVIYKPDEIEVEGYRKIVDDFFIKYLDDEILKAIQRRLAGFTTISRYQIVKAAYEDIDIFKNMLMEEVIVLPVGYRDEFHGKITPIGKEYNLLVKFRNSIEDDIITNLNAQNAISAYNQIVKIIQTIFIEDTQETNPQKKVKSILESVDHKEGTIRGQALSNRYDYNGRAVISTDPTLALGTAKIPMKILKKIMAFDIMKMYPAGSDPIKMYKEDKDLESKVYQILKENPDYLVAIGRQPTLHNLGVQAVKPIPSDGETIIIPPLGTAAFNADFDGDKEYVNSAISDKAKDDLKKMYILNHLRLAKSGEIHNMPKQDIMYGITKALEVEPTGVPVEKYTIDVMLIMLMDREIQPQDVVDGNESVARYLLKAILNKKDLKEVSPKVINSVLDAAVKADAGPNVILDRLTKLGVMVANVFPAAISVLDEFKETDKFKKSFMIDKKEIKRLKNLGLISPALATRLFVEKQNEMSDKIKKEVTKDKFKSSNGFMQLSSRHGRGSDSNLQQIFSSVGILSKNDTQAFNASVTKGLSDGLTSMEHHATAYSGRQGLIDKVVETSQPGYLTRLLVHTGCEGVITEEDCGTDKGIPMFAERLVYYTDGVTIMPDDVIATLQGQDPLSEQIIPEAKALLRDMIVGRFVVLDGESKFIERNNLSDKVFDEYITKNKTIYIRSPLTCLNPTCKKCYGVDLDDNKMGLPKIGKRIGYLASHAVSEPSTQLTMKSFHKGSTFGQENLMSAFDTISKLWKMNSIDEEFSVTNKIVSGLSGVSYNVNRDGNLIVIRGNKSYKYTTAVPNESTEVGSCILRDTFTKDFVQVEEVKGSMEAAVEQLLSIYRIYRKEISVNFKHFETILNESVFFAHTDDLGKSYTRKQLYDAFGENPIEVEGRTIKVDDSFISKLIGCKDSHFATPDAIRGLCTEKLRSNIVKSVLVRKSDSFENPIVRQVFGLR